MSCNVISVQQYLDSSDMPLIDVRSPSEYQSGHIPRAINIPLLSDEDRAKVGISYKHNGKKQAMLVGLSLVGPKLRSIVEKVSAESNSQNLILHCWRGGQRSKNMAWLLQTAGFQISLLENGYKAYRNYIHEYFETTAFRFVVLGGKTGSAKTQILNRLKILGEQIIDLEALARHKGSAFGWIGELDQNTNEQFENNLFEDLYPLNHSKIIWVENESKTIGRNYIPESLWFKFKKAPLINLKIELGQRLDHLIHCYNILDQKALIHSFEKIIKRLGYENCNKAMEYIKSGNYEEAAKIALLYYDKCYEYNLKENKSPEIHNLKFDHLDINKISLELVKFKNEYFER